MRVMRGVVVPTETEAKEEAIAVEGGAGTASPRSDLLPISSRTSTYVSLPPYPGGKLRPLPERCASATVDSRGWRHPPFPVGTMGTTTTAVAVAVSDTMSHATSLGRGRVRAVRPPKTYLSALGNGSRRRRRSGSGVGARKTGQGPGMNRRCRRCHCLVVT